jgi:Phosphotransferase enzyme family
MSGINAQLIEALVSHSQDRFYVALAQISRGDELRGHSGAEFAIAVAIEMSKRADMPERLQAQRLGALLSKLNLNVTDKDVLATQARSLPAGLLNEVDSYLSDTQRQRLHSREENLLMRDIAHAAMELAIAQPIDASAPPSANESDPIGSWSTVLLLSKILNQDGNKRLLRGARFGTTQLDSREKLSEELESSVDICAVLIDGSFLREMNEDEQISFFDKLAIYSTFVWIRIDESGLRISHFDVRKSLRRARCQREQVASHEVSIQPDGRLREAELVEIWRACHVLRTHDGARFIPGEITDGEGLVLLAAAQEHAQELEYKGDLEVRSLETKFLPGGLSEAKIVLVRVNQAGKYIVAKIDRKEVLLDEMKRFQCFIQKWDDKLRPRLFFHGFAGLIIFSLVPDETNPAKPAPMFKEYLENLWNEEIFRSLNDPELDLKVSNLKSGLNKLARSLRELNRTFPLTNEFPCKSNPDMTYLRRLEQRRITWKFCSQAIKARELSESQFAQLAESAIVHGDLHLGNILVRGDHDMHLIDYAGSGPGHPAIDLVRLELALFLGCFKQQEEES